MKEWKYLEYWCNAYRELKKIFWWNDPCKVSIITHTFIVVFSSDVTGIVVNK